MKDQIVNINRPVDPLLKKAEAAAFLQVTQRCLDGWMAQGIIPFYKLGKRAVRFKRADIEAHMDANCRIVNGANR
jgi:excisionase family DNA binding protein